MRKDEIKETILIILGFIIAAPLIIGIVISFAKDALEKAGNLSQYIIPAILVISGIAFLNYIYELNKDKKKKPTSYTLYGSDYPKNWDDIRTQALRRDGYQCGNCDSSTNLRVHHIVPISKGGTNKLSNLRTLCDEYHKKLHPHMR